MVFRITLATSVACIIGLLMCKSLAAVRQLDVKLVQTDETDGGRKDEVGLGAVAAGKMLRGRYKLHSFMHREEWHPAMIPRGGDFFGGGILRGGDRFGGGRDHGWGYGMGGVHGGMGGGAMGGVGQQFPANGKLQEFASRARPEHLGTGSFGDVWKAWDTVRNEYVALKIFYKDKMYLTLHTAKMYQLMDALRSNMEECKVVMNMAQQEALFPDGAKRLCMCFGEHISDARSGEPLFLVQEMCGKSMADIHKEVRYDASFVRRVIKEVLQAIVFLNKMDPPMLHHDLKLENAVVSDQGNAKLIDFGALVPFTQPYKPGVACTPMMAPPETPECYQPPLFDSRGQSWAFDTWAAGVMYWELLCRQRPARQKIPHHRKCFDGSTGLGDSHDFDIINALLQVNPRARMAPDQAVAALEKRDPSRQEEVIEPEHLSPTPRPLVHGEILCDEFGPAELRMSDDGAYTVFFYAEGPENCNSYPRLTSPAVWCESGYKAMGHVAYSTGFKVENKAIWQIPRGSGSCEFRVSPRVNKKGPVLVFK
eukprot:TRINITY_DN4534_c0_g1_i1.p1 TRINITY_DN4534_c0_g1~~TRINITY_DN4534_c0_g1_i1.p1  ORF type:complete len:537 (+),score=106.69 TRINITY_DN4534_c0_g1_i1:79-1689(+)